jgi:hypothetical protein
MISKLEIHLDFTQDQFVPADPVNCDPEIPGHFQ